MLVDSNHRKLHSSHASCTWAEYPTVKRTDLELAVQSCSICRHQQLHVFCRLGHGRARHQGPEHSTVASLT